MRKETGKRGRDRKKGEREKREIQSEGRLRGRERRDGEKL